MTCRQSRPSVRPGTAWPWALAGLVCTGSRPEPRRAASVAEPPGFGGRRWRQRIHTQGLGLSHWLRTQGCSPHQLSDALVAPKRISEKGCLVNKYVND